MAHSVNLSASREDLNSPLTRTNLVAGQSAFGFGVDQRAVCRQVGFPVGLTVFAATFNSQLRIERQ
jgi:hypothetical protein